MAINRTNVEEALAVDWGTTGSFYTALSTVVTAARERLDLMPLEDGTYPPELIDRLANWLIKWDSPSDQGAWLPSRHTRAR